MFSGYSIVWNKLVNMTKFKAKLEGKNFGATTLGENKEADFRADTYSISFYERNSSKFSASATIGTNRR